MHNPSSQLVDVNGKLFMIDCGEGTQLQMRSWVLAWADSTYLYIHLRRPCVWTSGLISSLGLLGRTAELTIYAHQEIEQFLTPFLNFFCKNLSYNVRLVLLKRKGHNLIYENKSITISSFPLNISIATSGFLFKETEKLRHIKREMIDYYDIPIREINNIKMEQTSLP